MEGSGFTGKLGFLDISPWVLGKFLSFWRMSPDFRQKLLNLFHKFEFWDFWAWFLVFLHFEFLSECPKKACSRGKWVNWNPHIGCGVSLKLSWWACFDGKPNSLSFKFGICHKLESCGRELPGKSQPDDKGFCDQTWTHSGRKSRWTCLWRSGTPTPPTTTWPTGAWTTHRSPPTTPSWWVTPRKSGQLALTICQIRSNSKLQEDTRRRSTR